MPNPDTTSVSKVDVSHIISQTPPGENPGEQKPGEGDAPAEPTAEELAAKAALDAAKPKEEAPADLSLTPSEPAKVEVNSTGVEAFDVVGTMLGDKGVENANEIMDAFLETGEVSLEHKAAMIEALGEGVANMAFKQMEGAASKIIADAKADSQKSMDYANELFGGENAATTWKEMQEYVRTPEAGFSEADLAAMNTMLEAGGLQAQLVIDKVHKVYNADPGNSLPGNLLEGDSAANGLTFEPISRADYSAEMSTAVRKYGEDSHQVRELDRRRTLSIQRGI